MSNARLHDALARRRRDEAVLTGDAAVITAGDLVDGIERLSATLHALRLGHRPRVGVVMANGPRLAATCLATMAVATCAPLDPRSRPEELRRAFRRLEVDVVVVDDQAGLVAELAVESGVGLLAAPSNGEWCPELVLGPETATGRDYDGPALSLLLSSSGTTADPKLIGLTGANLLSSADAVASVLQLDAGDRCLNVMPLFHIHGIVGALLSSVVSGAAIECTAGFDAFSFRRRLSSPGITWSTAVPTMYQAMLLRGGAEAGASGIRVLRSSSAPLRPAVWLALEAQFGCPVLNSYGMTEAAHQMASNPLPPAERRVGSVGRGAGAEVAILQEGAVTQLPGAEGEVVIRGAGVMAGYLAPVGANDAAWVDGWFRTGDLGVLDADEYLTLIGRSKEIINVGGETVSPFEIEAVVLDHPDVVDAVAFALPDERRGESVGLAVVPSSAGVEPDALRRFVAERLSRSKVPSHIVLVERIPLGPTGKVQRTRLPDLLGLV